MRSLRVLRNAVTNYMRFIVGGLVGFVLTPLMVRLLGDGDYGLWVAIFSLTGYFGLFDQGIRPSLVRFVSADHARGNFDGLARTMSTALVLYGGVGLVTLSVTAAAAVAFPVLFRIDPSQVTAARTVVMLSGASLALGFPFGVFGATLSGLQRYDIANAIGIGVSLLRAAAFVAVLRLNLGLVGLAWASLVTNLLGHVLSWVFARRLLPQVRLGVRFVGRDHLKRIASYSSLAFIGALATSIAFQTDALVITGFLGAALVTPFAIANSLVDMVRSLVYSATWVLAPTASELETRGESHKLHEMLIAGAKYSVLMSWPVLFACILFGRNIITTWVDAEHASAATLLTILAVPTLLALPQSAASSIMFGISRHKGIVFLSIANAVLNLGLSILWVKPYGLVGVAFGTAVPLALVSGVATMVFACRALELPFGRYLWQGMVRPGLASLVFVVLAVGAQWAFHPLGWPALIGTCAACWAPFALVAWRMVLDRPERERWGRTVPGLFGLGPSAASAR